MNPANLSVPSFAKINLTLQILGKRADGYHEVRTVLQTISLHDQIHFQSRTDNNIKLICTDPEIPGDERNLIVRAARALNDRYQVNCGADIRLFKNIPSQAGLGGASSNAATALLALTQLWEIDADAETLQSLAADIGADVPFFLHGGCALATGTGSSISMLPDSAQQYVIVVSPNAKVPTAEAYAAFSASALTSTDGKPILASSFADANFANSRQWHPQDELVNDFEKVIFDKEPEIGRAKVALLNAGADAALMAGSGSSVFGIFSTFASQQSAINKTALEPGWRLFPCVTLSRAEYEVELSSSGISLRSFKAESDIGA